MSDINGTKKVERPNVAPPPPPLPPRDRSKPSLPQSKPRERKYPLLIPGLTDNATQHGAEIYQNPDADGLVVEKSTAAFRKLSTGSIPPSSPSAINGDSQRTQQAIVINQSGREVSFWPRIIGSLFLLLIFFLFFLLFLLFFSTKGPMFPSSVDHDSLQWSFLLYSLHTRHEGSHRIIKCNFSKCDFLFWLRSRGMWIKRFLPCTACRTWFFFSGIVTEPILCLPY